MAEAGILNGDERVELIEGEIVEMSPIGSRHGSCVDFVTRLCVTRLGESAIVRVQGSIRLDGRNEPEPDIALLKPREDFYSEELPGPNDVMVVMEVADTTLPYDREVKLPLYARAGIPEAWLIDLGGSIVERHTEPAHGTYRARILAVRGEELQSTAIPGLVLRADDVLR